MNVCKACGKSFIRLSNWRFENYCSFHCVETTRRTKKWICQKCGTIIESPHKRFLCDNCRRAKRIVRCEFCDKEIKIDQTQEKHKHHFCSKSCYLKFMDIKAKWVNCSNCGKEIRITPKKFGQKNYFCSKQCKYEWNRGENNYGWVGGSSEYRGDNWQKERRKALKRDGGKCILSQQKYGDKKVDVHHIIPYRVANVNYLWNLVTLRRDLHKRIELLSHKVSLKLQDFGLTLTQSWGLVLLFVYNAIVREKLEESFVIRMLYDRRERAAKYIATYMFLRYKNGGKETLQRLADMGLRPKLLTG